MGTTTFRRLLVGMIVLVAVAQAAGVVTVLRRVDTVTVADAVARFRDAGVTAPPQVTATTAAPVSSTGAAQTEGAAGAVEPGETASTPPPPTASETTVPAAVPSPRSLPAAGVYVYRTEGGERVGVPGGGRSYPAETTMTWTPTTCGVDVRWDVFEERWDGWALCSEGTGIAVATYTTYHEVLGVVEHREFQCVAGTMLRPKDDVGTSTGSCAEPTATAAVVTTAMGVEEVVVDGEAIQAVRVHIELTMTGSLEGTRIDDVWFRATDSLILRHHSTTDANGDSAFGRVSYTEDVRLDLVSTTPQT